MKSLALFALLLTSRTMPAQTLAPATATAPRRIQVPEAWAMGNLLEVVQHAYPEEAIKQGIGGKVVLKVVVDTEGKVTEAVPVQGDPLLVKACVDVVTKWKFRPYIRNNQKVEVESTATIEFLLATSEVRAPKPYNGPVRRGLRKAYLKKWPSASQIPYTRQRQLRMASKAMCSSPA